MSSQLLVFCDRETLSYHTMVRVWSRSILERSCHLQLRRDSAMRLRNGHVAITDTIKRSALQTFARHTDDTKNRSKVIALRKDISLVCTLFLSLQSRPDFDLDNFFKYEHQKEPPSLSDQGKLRSGTKTDVLQCLTIPKLTPPDDVTVKVLDGPAVVHMVRPTYGTNYQQYVVRHFMSFITNSLTNSTSRLDIIWDNYPDHNLKAQAQAKRGNPGVTTIVEGSTPVSRDWNEFLANSRNKVQLFRFLSKAVIEAASQFNDVVVCSTYDDHELVNTSDSQLVADFDTIMPYNHQEADSRIFLHLFHAAQQGHSKAFIRTVDSDAVIIAVGHFGSLSVMELWIGFGIGKAFQHIPVHEITQTLGPEKSLSCPLFHSFTGCDTTSTFLGIGKKTAWAAWQAYPDLTETLLTLSDDPTLLTLDSIHMARLERWTVAMYIKSSGCSRVNDVRRQLFTHGTRTLDHTPPHRKRCFNMQSELCTRQVTYGDKQGSDTMMSRMLQRGIGRKTMNTKLWVPFWTVLDDASKACALLHHCGCGKACRGNCICARAGIKCTILCNCEGGCINNDGV